MEECCKRIKKRSEEERRSLANRLSRIEGQIRGLNKMVENDAYCNDVLTQVSAVQSAISAFARELLASHMRSCVVNDIKEGKSETVDELILTVGKLIR
jgi:DNA-binding FrmR family transcriptional regulator